MHLIKIAKALLPAALILFLIASCGSKPVHFNPNFYEFVTKEGGYITDEHLTEKIYCNEPRIRKEFAALHISKIIELKKILREARLPNFSDDENDSDNLENQKQEILGELQRIINISQMTQ